MAFKPPNSWRNACGMGISVNKINECILLFFIVNSGRNGVEPDMYLPRAWLGLFSCWLPLATRVLLLRSLEEGMEPLLALTLAILDHVGRRGHDVGPVAERPD